MSMMLFSMSVLLICMWIVFWCLMFGGLFGMSDIGIEKWFVSVLSECLMEEVS